MVMYQETGTPIYTKYLGPTMSSLKYKTFRSHLATMALRRLYLPSQCLRFQVK